jgi:nitrate/nitrite transporter NarK
VISAVWSWLPSYLHRVHGLTEADAGIKAALVVLCGAFGSVVWGSLIDRVGRSRPGGKLRMLALLCFATMLVLSFAFGASNLGLRLSQQAQFALIAVGGFLMTCTAGPAAAIVIDVTHPGVRSTGAKLTQATRNALNR